MATKRSPRVGHTPRLYPSLCNSPPPAVPQSPGQGVLRSALARQSYPLTLRRVCGDLVPSRDIPPPQHTQCLLFPGDASQEGSRARPFVLALPGMGVWTKPEVQCVLSLCPRERQSARLPRASVCGALAPPTRGWRTRVPCCVCVWVRARVLFRLCARGASRARERAVGAVRLGAGGVWARAGRGPRLRPPREPAPPSRGPCNGTCSPLRVKKLETLFAQQSAPRSRQSV